jgi:ssDNA-binding Zn-finger/Zn-ribbon topoisomerase 1
MTSTIPPACPICRSLMHLTPGRRGGQYWVCDRAPKCGGTLSLKAAVHNYRRQQPRPLVSEALGAQFNPERTPN